MGGNLDAIVHVFPESILFSTSTPNMGWVGGAQEIFTCESPAMALGTGDPTPAVVAAKNPATILRIKPLSTANSNDDPSTFPQDLDASSLLFMKVALTAVSTDHLMKDTIAWCRMH